MGIIGQIVCLLWQVQRPLKTDLMWFATQAGQHWEAYASTGWNLVSGCYFVPRTSGSHPFFQLCIFPRCPLESLQKQSIWSGICGALGFVGRFGSHIYHFEGFFPFLVNGLQLVCFTLASACRK